VSDAVATYGWPALLRTPLAATYAACSRWTISRAVREGKLMPAGRRGNSLVFEREELDRWMRGDRVDPQAPTLDRRRHESTESLAETMRRVRAAGARGRR